MPAVNGVLFRLMPAELRCDPYVVPEMDRTGEHAIECCAIAVDEVRLRGGALRQGRPPLTGYKFNANVRE
jgi:hypothetical protein